MAHLTSRCLGVSLGLLAVTTWPFAAAGGARHDVGGHSRAVPVSSGGQTLVTEPKDGLEPIYKLMSGARHVLDMTMYELSDTRAEGVLDADAARGVVVRVLLNREYEGASVNSPAFRQLKHHGVDVRWAYSRAIYHQKTITVDNHTAAIMTLNLTSKSYATSRDFALFTHNKTDVAQIAKVFSEDWKASAPPRPESPHGGLVWSPDSQKPLVTLVSSARHSLLVENEEMSDAPIEHALEVDARRGVDVDVVMTYSRSKVDAFRALVRAGVHVRTYAGNAALYIHAKALVIDGRRAFIGSENFSAPSLDINRELGVEIQNAGIVSAVAGTLRADFAGAKRFS